MGLRRGKFSESTTLVGLKSMLFIDGRPSYKGLTVDALADDSDEGRGKLRKVSGSCTRTVIRECPNGETLLGESLGIFLLNS